LVVAVTVLLALVGGWALMRLPIDAVPDITNVQVQVTTEIPALIPEDVERQVTWPIETAMAGVPHLETTWSLSRYGFSQVTVVFKDGTDLYFARQQVAERLAQAREHLPRTAEPRLGPIATGLGEVLVYTVSFAHPQGVDAPRSAAGQAGWHGDGVYQTPEGERLTTTDTQAAYLRTIQDWVVVPQLRTLPGLADVDVIGGAKKQYVVNPDPVRLTAYGLGLRDVADAVERNNRALGGGFIERFGESHVVLADGRVRTTDDIGRIVIATREGTPIHVSDVAQVAISHESRTGSASRDGHEVVMGTVMMLFGGNSRAVAAAANARLTDIRRDLPPDVTLSVVLNRQTLVDSVIKTVGTNLAEGAVLVAAILFVVLGNLRGALITATVIPLCMLLTAIGMRQLGISGNLMSLGAIDFGIIIDTAVIIVENCLRRLAERQQQFARPLLHDERLAEVYAATRQMVVPAVFGQTIIITVYIPILLLTGIEGKMFHPMAMTVILALVAAFVLSLTFVPAMVALVVRRPVVESENRLMAAARRGYAPVLATALRLPGTMMIGAALILACGFWLFTRLGSEFIPTLDEGNFACEVSRIPSIGMEHSNRMQLRLEAALKGIPEVQMVFAKTGTAELAFDPMPWNTSDTMIILKPRSAWPDQTLSKGAVLEKVQRVAEQQLGNRYEFSQPIQLRFNELLAGVRADVAVKIFGDDFAVMLPAAERIAKALRAVPGAVDVRIEQVDGSSNLVVDARRDVAARMGINVADIHETVAMATAGQDVGLVFEGDRRYALVVRLPDVLRNDPEALKRLPIPLSAGIGDSATESASGGHGAAAPRTMPVGNLASLRFVDGTNQISRDNGKRRVVVQCNVRSRDLGGFVTDAKSRLSRDVPLPTGTWIQWGGQFAHYEEARDRLAVVVPLCFAIIFLLLYSTFGAARYAVLVFSAVPLALTGGVAALWLRGMPFSISAAVGFIALSGVAVLNGVVLVSCINELRRSGVALDVAVRDGSLLRLRPVLMTALVASLGFIPMAFSSSQGAEVQKPLATVIIGGILTSTVLTLIVLPALYRLFHWRQPSSTAAAGDPVAPASV